MSSRTPFNYEELMRSQKYTDLTLSCQGQEFKVHRAIVCTESSVFAAACDDGFKETATIHLDGFDVDTVKQIIMFMYTHTYHDITQAEPEGVAVLGADSPQETASAVGTETKGELQLNVHQTASVVETETKGETGEVVRSKTLKSLLFHVKMNSIANYYDISELRHYASTKVQNILNTSWSSRDFSVVIREVVNSTKDKELHDILSGVMAAHIDELIGLGEDIAPPEVISDFAGNVLRKLTVATKSMKDILVRSIKDLQSQLHGTKQQFQLERSAHESTSVKMKGIENSTLLFSQLLAS
ncbi:hypothetical protein Egran_07025 [Elaphomyces granulatus]|uniref:BTB domain-containing protein n=1 Tax=Elaphomyces granulatus TaxID=519963 RepID=A0A232LN17_9EURO|nr:hypothetical protein Egran_07025 [Elaphomyces granulatus]